MSEIGFGSCRKEGCTVTEDGQCMEGLSLTECPNYRHPSPTGRADADSAGHEPSDEFEDLAADEMEDKRYLPLFPGGDLTVDEASAITRAAPARVIVLAGEIESGKTTILAVLNDLFQRGPFAGFLFCASRSLTAFELRCFESRLESARESPATAHTPPSRGIRFLHLAVRRQSPLGPRRDLLMSDISGEAFRAAVNTADDARMLDVVKRADHFVLLLDAARLSNLEQRQGARYNGIAVLDRLLVEGFLGAQSHVDVVFSMWDVVVAPRNEDAVAFVERIKEQLSVRYEGRFGKLTFHEVAARPEHDRPVALGHGLAELLQSWVNDSPFDAPVSRSPMPRPEDAREFTRFVWRGPMAP